MERVTEYEVTIKVRVTETMCRGSRDSMGVPEEPDSVERDVEILDMDAPEHWGPRDQEQIEDVIYQIEV
jgi:uncharacterized protein (DUF169 family)